MATVTTATAVTCGAKAVTLSDLIGQHEVNGGLLRRREGNGRTHTSSLHCHVINPVDKTILIDSKLSQQERQDMVHLKLSAAASKEVLSGTKRCVDNVPKRIGIASAVLSAATSAAPGVSVHKMLAHAIAIESSLARMRAPGTTASCLASCFPPRRSTATAIGWQVGAVSIM